MTDHRPTALVTDAADPQAVATIRSLGRAGWRVVATGHDPGAPGLRSRWVAAGHVIPAAEHEQSAALEALTDRCQSEQVDLLIPVCDQSILAVSSARHRFGSTSVALPTPASLELAMDKGQTLALAAEIGIPIPETRMVTAPGELTEATSGLGWPLVVKPVRSHRPAEDGTTVTQPVGYALGPGELETRLAPFGSDAFPVLLQRYAEGVGVGVELLTDRGRPLAAFQHRRLREMPISGGPSSLRVSEAVDPALLTMSARLLTAMEWTGLAMVEYRVGADGPVLMEVNGRIWGSMALPVLAGMDFPRRMADLFLDGPVDGDGHRDDDGHGHGDATDVIDQRYRVGVECRNLELELRWIASALNQLRRPPAVGPHPGIGEILRVAAGLVDPRTSFDVQSLADPRPGLADLRRVMGALTAEARTRIGDRMRTGRR